MFSILQLDYQHLEYCSRAVFQSGTLIVWIQLLMVGFPNKTRWQIFFSYQIPVMFKSWIGVWLNQMWMEQCNITLLLLVLLIKSISRKILVQWIFRLTKSLPMLTTQARGIDQFLVFQRMEDQFTRLCTEVVKLTATAKWIFAMAWWSMVNMPMCQLCSILTLLDATDLEVILKIWANNALQNQEAAIWMRNLHGGNGGEMVLSQRKWRTFLS